MVNASLLEPPISLSIKNRTREIHEKLSPKGKQGRCLRFGLSFFFPVEIKVLSGGYLDYEPRFIRRDDPGWATLRPSVVDADHSAPGDNP